MIRYYTSRVLSEKLDINLAKWKRWSREFLPPDPLVGKQSGYTRQYALPDVFTVCLGGYMVGNLNLSIPDSKIILTHILEWMTENQVAVDPNGPADGVSKEMIPKFLGIDLIVRTDSGSNSHCLIRQTLDLKISEPGAMPDLKGDGKTSGESKNRVSEVYTETQITDVFRTKDGNPEECVPVSEKVLHISSVMKELLVKLGH